MPSGGHRDGQIGKAYANRSDLAQAPHAATGQQYGQAKQQLDAQKVIPLPLATPAGGSPQTSTPPPAGVAVPPGALPFDRPTDRPNEPLTAGLPFGPGPDQLAGQSGATQDLLEWQPYLPTLELLASLPGSTQSTRNFVRRLRSVMPSGPT